MDYDDVAAKQLGQFKQDNQSTTGRQLEDNDLHYRVAIQTRDAAFLGYCHLSFLNAQAKTIRRLMWAAVILLVLGLAR